MPNKATPKEREKDIQASIMQFLQLKGIFHYRNNTGAIAISEGKRFLRFGALGSPDIIAVIRGIYIGIEVKAPGKKLRESQIGFKHELEKAGGMYWVFDSLDSAVAMIEYFTKRKSGGNPNFSQGYL